MKVRSYPTKILHRKLLAMEVYQLTFAHFGGFVFQSSFFLVHLFYFIIHISPSQDSGIQFLFPHTLKCFDLLLFTTNLKFHLLREVFFNYLLQIKQTPARIVLVILLICVLFKIISIKEWGCSSHLPGTYETLRFNPHYQTNKQTNKPHKGFLLVK